ncbi:MAG: hypothetical protein E7370_03355 [Clostridiales bacterium]|nr:hypothetical protein [Clostridiales bacterium]
MNENVIVEELFNEINEHGVLHTLISVFGKGAFFEMNFTQKLCDTEVTSLNISVRAQNGLMRAGCKTVGQLINMINEGSLIKVRQLGVKSVAELRSFVVELGYQQMSDKRKKEFLRNIVRANAVKRGDE